MSNEEGGPVIEEITEEEQVENTTEETNVEEEDVQLPANAFGKTKKPSRTEKKSRKAMAKIGLNPFPGVTRVTIKQGPTMFAISEPEVYKGVGNTYVIIGVAKYEDQSAARNKNLLNLLKENAEGLGVPADTLNSVETEQEESKAEASSEGTFTDKEIDLVMKQANVSRDQAVDALKKNNGDIVNSIMTLTGI